MRNYRIIRHYHDKTWKGYIAKIQYNGKSVNVVNANRRLLLWKFEDDLENLS